MSSRRRLDPAGNAPAIALAVAAGLHLTALPDHAGQGLGVAGFLATATFQLTATWVVARGSVGATARLGIATVAEPRVASPAHPSDGVTQLVHRPHRADPADWALGGVGSCAPPILFAGAPTGAATS